MPNMPEMKNWITVGNVLQIGTMLVLLAVAYANLDARSNAAEMDVADHEVRLRVLESTVSSALSRIDAKLENIEEALNK